MPAFNDSASEPREGWGIIRPGDREAHYYRRMDSLCGRAGFYHGPLDPDENHMPDDCPACREMLDREAMRQGFPDPETEALMQEELRIEMEVMRDATG